MLHSTTAVFLDHISRDLGDVTVVLVELCWTLRGILISSTAAIALQSGHCCLEEFSQSSKISVLVMSVTNSCDSLLNLLIFCVWLKS